MGPRAPQILLVGKGVRQACALVERLRERGCACQLATSYGEARSLLEASGFDLVLSETDLPDGNAHHLRSLLAGSRTTLYYWLAVQDGCWWLPALEQGQQRWGAPALRPSEFAQALDAMLEQMRSCARESAPLEVASVPAVTEVPPAIPPKKTAAAQTRGAHKRASSA